MPIDYKKYAPNWQTEITPQIKKRANNCCEFCGVKNRQWIQRLKTDKLVYRYSRSAEDVILSTMPSFMLRIGGRTVRKTARLKKSCRWCGSDRGIITQTTNIHPARIDCANCHKFIKWLSKKDFERAIALKLVDEVSK